MIVYQLVCELICYADWGKSTGQGDARSVAFGSGANGYHWVDRSGNEIEPNEPVEGWSLYKLCR